jgi:dimethylaniline monooxygenase (N-oxide forming)
MNLTDVKNVAIIGAGVAGLSTAKLLLAQGLNCTVFERGAVLGGVWAAGYSNFGAQVQRELYEFPDWPLPQDTPDFTPGPMIQKYLENYARHFGVWRNIRFNASVTHLRERQGGKAGWVVSVDQAGVPREQEFDLVVVCIGLFSNIPHIPPFPGQDRFKGQILHSSEFRNRDQLTGKKVAVIGFGKSATDAALEAAAVAKETTVIFREAHWPLPAMVAGVLPFKWIMLNRFTSTLIPPYYRPSGLERVVHTVGKPLVWLWWRLVQLLLMVQCRMGSRFGSRVSLVPKQPVEFDGFGESAMLPRPEFFRSLRNGAIQPQKTEIAEYTASGLALKNGTNVEADAVVFATGWRSDYRFLPDSLRARFNFEKDGLYLYRQMIHPDVPHLVFIGHCATVINILTCNLQARWLGELIKGRHRLPAREAMIHNIEALKAWKRRRLPFSAGRSARLIFHMQHYHDELLKDFGANPRRKTGFLAWFKEIFAPYQPSDYRTIVSGEWEGKARQQPDQARPVGLFAKKTKAIN